MKLRHFLLIGLFLIGGLINAQETKKNFIEVTGIAEMEVEPDEIIFNVGIKGDNKNQLAENEKQLFEILKNNGVKNEDIKFKSMYQNIYSKTKIFTKNLQFKVTKKTDMGNLFENLNQKWVNNINIAEIKNTKITDFRKTVKINALKAAKDKADYLLESIGKKVGTPLEITEIEDYTSDNVIPMNFRAKTANIQLEAADSNVDYSFENIDNIKLKYSIKTKYEIL